MLGWGLLCEGYGRSVRIPTVSEFSLRAADMAGAIGAMTDIPTDSRNGPPEFEGRKPEVLDAVVQFRDGEQLLAPGQSLLALNEPSGGLFHLARGWLVYCAGGPPGQPYKILQFGLPGAVIGYSNKTADFSVQALGAAAVSVLPASNLSALSRERPGVGERLHSLAARPLSFALQHMPKTTPRSARACVAQLLLELFIRARAQWPDHAVEHMRLPLSSQNVVSATGAETAPDVLGELAQESILRLDERGIAILDPDALTDASGIELAAMRSFLLG